MTNDVKAVSLRKTVNHFPRHLAGIRSRSPRPRRWPGGRGLPALPLLSWSRSPDRRASSMLGGITGPLARAARRLRVARRSWRHGREQAHRAPRSPRPGAGLAQVLDDGAAVELAAARWAVLDHRGRVPRAGPGDRRCSCHGREHHRGPVPLRAAGAGRGQGSTIGVLDDGRRCDAAVCPGTARGQRAGGASEEGAPRSPPPCP
jgi:hypothetical protein